MGKRIVLGTAGHVDHGKTSLVKALTGIDTDRLAEEKRRGITIELGFAHLALEGGTVAGVVDVPGHERFVRAMAAGAFGLDLVLLVVAVDEAVMPQTREHLDICRLLGVERGLVALTKADLLASLGPELVELARADVAEAVKGTFLEGAPVVPVSSRTGEGLEALKAALAALAKEAPERPADGPGFLPIDRAFTVKGFGTVVTGTLFAGQLREGDAVDLVPGGPRGARVRGLQAYGKPAAAIAAGMRAAVNLAGVETAAVKRGMVVSGAPSGGLEVQRAGAEGLAPTRMLDVELELLPTAPRAVRTRSKMLLHLGTGVAPAAITLLDRKSLEPGERAPVQLTLGEEVAALSGQRFILRGFSALPGRGRTWGGGRIVDPHPRRHRHHKLEAARSMAILGAGTPEERLLALFREAGLGGANAGALARRLALPEKAAERALSLLATRGAVVIFDKGERGGERAAVSREHFEALCARTERALDARARGHALSQGLSREELRKGLADGLSPKLLAKVLEALAAQGKAELDGEWVRRPGSLASAASDTADSLLSRVQGALAAAGLAPPRIGELAGALGADPARIQEALKLLRAEGKAVRVRDDMYFDAAAIASLRERLVARLRAQREIDIQGFKDLVGQTRKWTVPLGEYFDQERLTLRVGDKRVLRGGSP